MNEKQNKKFLTGCRCVVVNAERAALCAPFIRGKRRYTRLKNLQMLVERYWKEK
jgi:hypothetical protein